MVRMAQIGVPPPCVTLLAEAGVSAENMRDLPWGVLENMVCKVEGMGVVQLTLLRVLHARLQAELEVGAEQQDRISIELACRVEVGIAVRRWGS
jgi:hypothetical protein